MEKQNVGFGVVGNKLCDNFGGDDVYAADVGDGWNICGRGFGFDSYAVF